MFAHIRRHITSAFIDPDQVVEGMDEKTERKHMDSLLRTTPF
jgi:hypothetical protein